MATRKIVQQKRSRTTKSRVVGLPLTLPKESAIYRVEEWLPMDEPLTKEDVIFLHGNRTELYRDRPIGAEKLAVYVRAGLIKRIDANGKVIA